MMIFHKIDLKILIICLILVLFQNSNYAQETNSIKEKVDIIPSDVKNIEESSVLSSEINTLLVKGAQYDPNRNFLPYFNENISIKNNVPALKIENQKTRELTNSELELITPFKKWISSEFSVESYYSKTREAWVFYNRVNAVRFNVITSRYEVLIDYQPVWDYSISVPTPVNFGKKSQSTSYVNSSVLSTGQWYKIGLVKSGIYKMDKTFLQNLGIDVGNIDPKNIRVYGNGGKLMSEKNSDFKYDDLVENSIYVDGEADGVFDENDYVLFFGQSTDTWKRVNGSVMKFDHQLHYFSDTSFYFINVDIGAGKRISDIPSLQTVPTNTTSAYDYYDFHEQNWVNVVKSGREFYGEKFDVVTSYSFPFYIPDAVIGDSLLVKAGALSRWSDTTYYTVNYGSGSFLVRCPGTAINVYTADFGAPGNKAAGGILNNSSLNISVIKNTSSSLGYLDYVYFNARRQLLFTQQQFSFRDTRVIGGSGSAAQYFITDNNLLNPTIWDVTDPLNPTKQLYNSSGANIDFITESDSLKEFVIFGNNDLYIPTKYGLIENQNLHGIQQADYVIVCHPNFVNEANRLGQLHQQYDSLSYVVATTQQVYNEFSSGTPDIVGIRQFARMLYSRPSDPDKKLKYLLLLGDGSYDNKNINNPSNSAVIPTYETPNSWSYTLSFVTDDFFGMMDDNEGTMATTDAVDIGVGRFPVRTQSEASGCVSKIEAYYKKNEHLDIHTEESSCSNGTAYPLGDWRNWVCFIGDDEDNGLHMTQANQLASMVADSSKDYNVDKILLDAYVQYSTPGGQRYPDAVSDINRRFEKGALIVNYTGHGGELGLAHERIVEVSQILDWKNINNMPLMVTATCEFSRFDDPSRTSAGEYCFLNSQGGAISLFTTVRLAFSNFNFDLNRSFFKYALQPMPNGKMPAIGDLYRQNKVDIGNNILFQNFVILGDPALKLAYPQKRVYTSSINTHSVTLSSLDTLSALSKVTVTGYVGDDYGNKLTGFNGLVYPTVFDKKIQITCLLNDAASAVSGAPFKFDLQKNIIYKGKAQVVNGDFSFTFIVPKDISYQYGIGKISYYAHNGIIDANGHSENIVIGGSNPNAVVDNQGPVVNLYLNSNKFVSGGTTNETPDIYAEVADSSGINTVGTGIGHDIVAVLDENSNKPIVLNDYYEANLNSYQSGKIRYPFETLSEGNHKLSLKVWDVQNNSSTSYTDFVVAKSAELALSHVLNYPNPFTNKTKFFIEHNQCCTSLKVVIQIYTISGKVVKSITETINNDGFRFDGIEWDGKDEYGDKLGRGVYVYKVSVTDGQNKKAEKIEKLVILN